MIGLCLGQPPSTAPSAPLPCESSLDVFQASLVQSITDSTDMNLSKLEQILKDRGVWLCCNPQSHKELDTT